MNATVRPGNWAWPEDEGIDCCRFTTGVRVVRAAVARVAMQPLQRVRAEKGNQRLSHLRAFTEEHKLGRHADGVVPVSRG